MSLSPLVDNAEGVGFGFDDLVFMVLGLGDEHVCGKFFMVCWSFWRQRNMKLW